DDVVVGNLEADVAHRHLDQPPAGAIQQGDDLDRGGAPRAQLAQKIVEGQAGVDDVFDQHHVPALDRIVDVARDANPLVRLGAGVLLEVEVIDHERDLDLAREVREKEGDALEDADQDDRAAAVVAGDLPAERPKTSFELHRRDEDAADVLLAQVLDLERSISRLGEELLVVLAVEQADVDVRVNLAKHPQLAVLRR